MNSIAIIEAVNTTSLPFHGQHIITAMAAGVVYVAMKPIVENLGMSWSTQVRKLMGTKKKFNCVHMNMVAMDSKLRDVICIPLKKLNGWLFSINPAKVRDDIRDRLVRYQEECFTALHDYWTKGAAVRKSETTVDDRTPLRGIVNRIMGKYGMTYQAVYKLVHKEFGVKHIEELSSKQTAEAVEYLAGKVIEGEFLGRCIASNQGGNYNFPAETADPHDRKFGNAWMTPNVILDEKNRAPELELLAELEKDGYDIAGAKIRIHAMYGITRQFITMQKELHVAERYLSSLGDIIKNQTVSRGDNVSFTGTDKGVAYGGGSPRKLS